MTESVPAGWYPTPDGSQRYWDGEKWTNLPPIDPEPPLTVQRPKRPRRKTLIIASIVLAIVLLGGGTAGALVWKSANDQEIAAIAASKAAAAEAKKEQDAADAAQARQDAADDLERESRAASTAQIESSVKTMAEGHVVDGVIDGPVLSVSCSPTGGGSVDDLTELTTAFECFVSTKDNGDGTSTGYYYNATMNWTSGSFTYGMGRG